eukprot:SAG11_NODE_399_length_9764_cov_8.760993_8_plen_83_part_00
MTYFDGIVMFVVLCQFVEISFVCCSRNRYAGRVQPCSISSYCPSLSFGVGSARYLNAPFPSQARVKLILICTFPVPRLVWVG